jgi:pyridinium-3,5-bisthiocarboxylic acid mononucleotide nickel chelatase
MRIAYVNCHAGIAGDMFVGALLDAGLEFATLESELAKLGVDAEYRLSTRRVMRHAIAATKFDVDRPDGTGSIDGDPNAASDSHDDHGHHHDSHDHTANDQHSAHSQHAEHEKHGHDEQSAHEHDDSEPHEHGHSHKHQGVRRGLADVTTIIENANLSPGVTSRAIAIFRRLAEAEAAMHDRTPDTVHFHEVGAVDALVDIVGACIGLEALGIEKVYSSKLRVGGGQVRAAHGVLPVPAPGTLELLKGVPVEHTDLPFEMITPTGAAVITTIADSFGPAPVFVPEQVGYGAGGRDSKQVANFVRVEIGETADQVTNPVNELERDEVVMIATNLDDMTPEVYGYLMERLFAAGARDVFLEQVMMKKNRPGVVLNVLGDDTSKDALARVVFDETPTLGVRMTPMTRIILPREPGTVTTPWGEIRVKNAQWNDRTRSTPEYDDCAEIARQHSIPILDVYDAVRRAVTE